MRYYWFLADTSGEFAALSLVARLPASFPGSGLFGNRIAAASPLAWNLDQTETTS